MQNSPDPDSGSDELWLKGCVYLHHRDMLLHNNPGILYRHLHFYPEFLNKVAWLLFPVFYSGNSNCTA